MSLSLRSLSDKDILSRTRALTVREREVSLQLLLHLNEIERRKLHLKLGYGSMFDYCTAGLGYSASAAMRRIRTARCVGRFPEVYGLLESNEVNLSTISQVSRVLTRENQAAILNRIRGKSQREVEGIVAEYEPRAAIPPDRVRTVVMCVPLTASAQPSGAMGDHACVLSGGATAASMAPASSGMLLPSTGLEERHNRSGCNWGNSPVASPMDERNCGSCATDTPTARAACPGEAREAATIKRAVIQFSASEDFMAKVEKVRSLAWHRLPANASLEEVFELALDAFITKNDPGARQERRETRQRHAQAPGTTAETPSVQKETRTRTAEHARHIPARVRDQVFVKGKSRCAYTSHNGRRCASTHALQIDHIRPVARGGGNTTDNLRLLCAYHNRLEAERMMGPRGARDGPPAR